MRFFTVTAKTNDGKFDENTAPKDIKRWGKWFPMVLLIPGGLWDEAMSKLGPRNDVILKDGVQAINAVLSDTGVPVPTRGYNIKNAEDFGRWVTDAMKNEKFLAVQNGSGPAKKALDVPTVEGGATPSSQPILSSIARPPNTRSSHELSSKSTPDGICSMRIISRPRH